MRLEEKTDLIKIIIHYALLLLLGVFALISVKGIVACNTYNIKEYKPDFDIAMIMMIAIWMMVSGMLMVKDKAYEIYTGICYYLGHVFVIIFCIGNALQETAGHHFIEAVRSSTGAVNLLLPVINGVNHPFLLLVFLAILTAVLIPHFSARVLIISITFEILSWLAPGSRVALIIAMVIAVVLFALADSSLSNYILKDILKAMVNEGTVETAHNSFYDIKRPLDWIFFGLCIIGVIISFFTGKVYGWLEYMKIIFGDNYSEALNLSEDMIGTIILSFCVSMAVSATISSGIKIYANKKSKSVLVTVSSVLLDSLINIWILDWIVNVFVRLFYKEHGIIISPLLDLNISTFLPDSFMNRLPLWLQIVLVLLLVVVFLVVLFYSSAITIIIFVYVAASLVKGVVFVFAVNFVNSFVHVNVTERSTLAAFIILYFLNMLVSELAENINGPVSTMENV